MRTVLSEAQVQQYQRDGYFFPVRVMSEDEARALRARVEAIEARQGGRLDPAAVAFHRRATDAARAILYADAERNTARV